MDVNPELNVPETITDEEAKKRWLYRKMISDHLPVMLVLRNDSDKDNF